MFVLFRVCCYSIHKYNKNLDLSQQIKIFIVNRIASTVLLHHTCDEECYGSTRDVGVDVDAFIEHPHIFGIIGDLNDTLLARLNGAFGVFDADATAGGCRACDNKGCSSRIGEFKEVGNFLAPLLQSAEVVTQLLEGYLCTLQLFFCPDYTEECKQEDGQHYHTFHKLGKFYLCPPVLRRKRYVMVPTWISWSLSSNFTPRAALRASATRGEEGDTVEPLGW